MSFELDVCFICFHLFRAGSCSAQKMVAKRQNKPSFHLKSLFSSSYISIKMLPDIYPQQTEHCEPSPADI